METVLDVDVLETTDWIDSLKAVLMYRGPQRANFLLEKLTEEARREGALLPRSLNTPYVNTIPQDKEERSPGNREIEHKLRSIIRWNVLRSCFVLTKNLPS
jgi:pyruvate dehydrogenase E1 component